MRLNNDCIRDILIYLVDNLDIEITDNLKGSFNEITLLHIINLFNDTYSAKDIWYSVYCLSQSNYIETNNIKELTKQHS